MRWRMPAQALVVDTFDGIEVGEVVLRFPDGDAKSGGEVTARLVNGDALVRTVHFALDPGEPDDMPAAFRQWVLARCAARGYAVPEATDAPPRSPRATPTTPEPGIRLG